MISFDNITELFAIDLNNKLCIEINFRVVGLSDYQNCWMGKSPDESEYGKEVYWFGLSSDGSKAYDYNNFFDFANAPVFDGKSLKILWGSIELLSIDGCDPEERLLIYS